MHGRRSREGTGGTSPPRIWSGGTLIQIVPPRFRHLGTKKSVLWPSKYAKIAFSAGAPRGSRRSPRALSRLERGHPFPYATPLDTDPPSALAMRPPTPEVQTDLRLWEHDTVNLRTLLLAVRWSLKSTPAWLRDMCWKTKASKTSSSNSTSVSDLFRRPRYLINVKNFLFYIIFKVKENKRQYNYSNYHVSVFLWFDTSDLNFSNSLS